MRRFAQVLIAAIPALVGGASAVHAADTSCTSTLSGQIIGNIVVPNGRHARFPTQPSQGTYMF